MKGFCFLLLCLIPFNAVFAVGSSVAGAVAGATRVEAKSQYVAAASNQPPGKAPATAAAAEPETGYYDFIFGLGMTQALVGKSFIGISSTETDWVSQTHHNLQSLFGNVGLGYVAYLSTSERYFCKLAWFPSIEPVLNLYFDDLTAKGKVYLFNNPNLPTSTYNMPIRSTNLMIDVLLNVVSYQHFTLYVLGGIGEAWTRVSYNDAPNINGTVIRPPLSLRNRTETHKVYEWGAGVSYAIDCKVRIVFSYLYTHIGNFDTSTIGTLDGTPIQLVTPGGFSLRTQGFLLQLQYALS